MAALENFMLMLQTAQNLQGLRKDMRGNAVAYKAQVTAGRPIADIAAVMNGDADQYLIRLGWMDRFLIVGAPRTKLLAGLSVIGATGQEMLDYYNEMKTASQNLRAAAKTTGAEINTASDAVLAAVAVNDTVF